MTRCVFYMEDKTCCNKHCYGKFCKEHKKIIKNEYLNYKQKCNSFDSKICEKYSQISLQHLSVSNLENMIQIQNEEYKKLLNCLKSRHNFTVKYIHPSKRDKAHDNHLDKVYVKLLLCKTSLESLSIKFKNRLETIIHGLSVTYDIKKRSEYLVDINSKLGMLQNNYNLRDKELCYLFTFIANKKTITEVQIHLKCSASFEEIVSMYDKLEDELKNVQFSYNNINNAYNTVVDIIKLLNKKTEKQFFINMLSNKNDVTNDVEKINNNKYTNYNKLISQYLKKVSLKTNIERLYWSKHELKKYIYIWKQNNDIKANKYEDTLDEMKQSTLETLTDYCKALHMPIYLISNLT